MALGKAIGVYRLSRDVELRYLPSGQAVAKLGLVNSSKYKTQSGEQKEDTCFIDGSVFGKLAEVANQYLKKGSKIFIDAELKQDIWTGQDGSNQSRHTLKINSFEMLDSKQATQENHNQTSSYNKVPEIDVYEDQIPFN